MKRGGRILQILRTLSVIADRVGGVRANAEQHIVETGGRAEKRSWLVYTQGTGEKKEAPRSRERPYILAEKPRYPYVWVMSRAPTP